MKHLVLFFALVLSFCANAQNQTICPGQGIPTGWVKVDEYSCSCCGNYRVQYSIKRIDLLPNGSTVDMCAGQTVPSGWVKTEQYSCTCCGTARARMVIKRIDGMGAGAKETICSEQSIPAGWIKTSEFNCSCCRYNTKYTIVKYQGLPVGTTLTVCGGQYIPSGWSKTSEYSCSCCGTTARQITIKNISAAKAYAEPSIARSAEPADVYPNPASGFINVSVRNIEAPTAYTIYDQNGRNLITQQLSESESEVQNVLEINTSKLPKGMYFIRVTGLKGTITRKFIIE